MLVYHACLHICTHITSLSTLTYPKLKCLFRRSASRSKQLNGYWFTAGSIRNLRKVDRGPTENQQHQFIIGTMISPPIVIYAMLAQLNSCCQLSFDTLLRYLNLKWFIADTEFKACAIRVFCFCNCYILQFDWKIVLMPKRCVKAINFTQNIVISSSFKCKI